MSVIGFDVGNDNCVVAVAKQRGIDVLLNDESNRETPSVVSFGNKQRFLGAAGAASASMNPRSTISQIKGLLRLVGRSFREAHHDLRRLPFPASQSRTGGILIHIRYLNEDRSFSPVQILAMLLSHLKQIAEKDLAVPVSECVIGIPSYFTEPQRFAYLNAAAIAGLNPLRLMHDNAATALGYGIYKPDTSRQSLVVFVDIGHCDTQVSVVHFAGRQMRVISHAFDSNLGGRDFDEVLFEYFSEQFKERYQIDVSSNQRASVRLRVACEKLKKVLSANAEAPLSIECLLEDKDVKGFIKREEFESLSSDLLERVLVPCKKALIAAGVGGIDRIHSVELVGSGSRIPAVMRTLARFFRKEPSRTLNASECVARGCALQCAMLSPVFRVKDYEVQDSFPFSIGFSSDEGPSGSVPNGILFQSGELFPSVKVLALQRSDTFRLVIIYANQSELPPGVEQQISSFMVGPFQVSHGQKPKVKVRVRLNLHGIVYIESAALIEDVMDDSLSRETCRSDAASVEPELASGAYSDRRVNTADHGSFSHSKTGSAPFGRPRKQVASRRHEIRVSNMIYCGMTNAELTEAQEQEEKLANQDKLMEQTKDKRNDLEEYVYEIRNKLFEIYRSFASDTERECISSSLQQTEEWLYEEGDDETESIYARKLEELKKLVDPIENRFKEEARAQVTRELLNCIADNRTLAGSLTAYEQDAVNSECSKAEQWLLEKLQQQDSLPKNVDPVLWSHDIKRRTEDLKMFCQSHAAHKVSPSRGEDTRGSDLSGSPDNMKVD